METYLEVERRGLIFGIKGWILTSLLEQSVQLLSFSNLQLQKMLAQLILQLSSNPFFPSFFPSFPLREEERKNGKKRKIEKRMSNFLPPKVHPASVSSSAYDFPQQPFQKPPISLLVPSFPMGFGPKTGEAGGGRPGDELENGGR